MSNKTRGILSSYLVCIFLVDSRLREPRRSNSSQLILEALLISFFKKNQLGSRSATRVGMHAQCVRRELMSPSPINATEQAKPGTYSHRSTATARMSYTSSCVNGAHASCTLARPPGKQNSDLSLEKLG